MAANEYLTGQTRMLLLRIPDASGQAVMYAGPALINSPVVVTGTYPAQEVFCEALICDCEDYILVENIGER